MLDRWTVIDSPAASLPEDDSQYRDLLLASMGIDSDAPDMWEVLGRRSDDIFEEVGHLFGEAIAALRDSPTKSQYLLLFGREASDKDVFVLLFSFDLFAQVGQCLNDIKTLGEVGQTHMKDLVVACKL